MSLQAESCFYLVLPVFTSTVILTANPAWFYMLEGYVLPETVSGFVTSEERVRYVAEKSNKIRTPPAGRGCASPSTLEAEAGKISVLSGPAWSTYRNLSGKNKTQ